MAQSSKSRIVIWTIVGILVVVAAVMFLRKPKDATVGKPAVRAEHVDKLMGRLDKFEARIAKAKAEFPDAPAEKWQQVDDMVARGRQTLTDMQGMTEQKDLQAKLLEYQNGMIETRKVLKEITGMMDEEEPAGQ